MNSNKTNNFFFNKRVKYSFLTKLKSHLLKIELVLIFISSIGYLIQIKEITAISILLLALSCF